MSFFDDDDQPTRTARTPRPRRTSSRGGGTTPPSDQQQLLIRRAVAVGGLVLLLVLIVIGFNSCRTSARQDALREYNQNVAAITQDSEDQVAQPFFDLLLADNEMSPVALETQINQYRVVAEDQADRARDLDVPGEVVAAHRDLIMALDFRAEAIGGVADRIRTALGSEDAAEQAVNEIAGQMQKLLASDVIFSQRVAPLIKEALDENEVTGQNVATSKVLPNLGWLDPETVNARIGGGGGRDPEDEPTTPGPHGHGLVSVAVGDVTLQPEPTVNRIAAGSDTTFLVTFQNQGAADETDVEVNVRISGGGDPITVSETVPETVAGANAEVEIPLGQSPPIGTPVQIRVAVQPVPGEELETNNRQDYTAIFTR